MLLELLLGAQSKSAVPGAFRGKLVQVLWELVVIPGIKDEGDLQTSKHSSLPTSSSPHLPSSPLFLLLTAEEQLHFTHFPPHSPFRSTWHRWRDFPFLHPLPAGLHEWLGRRPGLSLHERQERGRHHRRHPRAAETHDGERHGRLGKSRLIRWGQPLALGVLLVSWWWWWWW